MRQCSVLSSSVQHHGRTVAHQAPLSVGFLWQEHWNGLPFPSSRDFDPGIEPTAPQLAGRFFTTAPPGKLVSSKAVLTQIYSVKCETIDEDFGAIVI